MSDGDTTNRASAVAELDLFPGEQPDQHKASAWKESASSRLGVLSLLVVASGGQPPSAACIMDEPLLPDLPPDHRDHERRLEYNNRIQTRIKENAVKRWFITMNAWTELYYLLARCCEKSAPTLFRTLQDRCNLEKTYGLKGGFMDGPLAWKIVNIWLDNVTRAKADKELHRKTVGGDQADGIDGADSGGAAGDTATEYTTDDTFKCLEDNKAAEMEELLEFEHMKKVEAKNRLENYCYSEKHTLDNKKKASDAIEERAEEDDLNLEDNDSFASPSAAVEPEPTKPVPAMMVETVAAPSLPSLKEVVLKTEVETQKVTEAAQMALTPTPTALGYIAILAGMMSIYAATGTLRGIVAMFIAHAHHAGHAQTLHKISCATTANVPIGEIRQDMNGDPRQEGGVIDNIHLRPANVKG